MKRLLLVVTTLFLVSIYNLTAQKSDSTIIQLFNEADMVIVSKVKKTKEVIISEDYENNSNPEKTKKLKEIYMLETESILKSKNKAKAPKKITTPEFYHNEPLTITLTSDMEASSDTFKIFFVNSIINELENIAQDLQYEYRITNPNKHIIYLREEKDGFIIIYKEEYNRKHVKLFEKLK